MFALPEEIKVLVAFLVTQGVKAVANLFGKDIGGIGAAGVAVLVGSIVFFAEGLLALVSPEKQEVVQSALALVALLLSSFGTHYTYKSIGK
jgi:hypothetical protein